METIENHWSNYSLLGPHYLHAPGLRGLCSPFARGHFLPPPPSKVHFCVQFVLKLCSEAFYHSFNSCVPLQRFHCIHSLSLSFFSCILLIPVYNCRFTVVVSCEIAHHSIPRPYLRGLLNEQCFRLQRAFDVYDPS